MFPTQEDIRAHKRAHTRKKKEEIELAQRADEISNPQELASFIIEIATKKYRRGERKMEFSVYVPMENFAEWAQSAKIGSKDLDSLDRSLIKNEVLRSVRNTIKRQLSQGVFMTLEGRCIAGTKLAFRVDMSVIRPS